MKFIEINKDKIIIPRPTVDGREVVEIRTLGKAKRYGTGGKVETWYECNMQNFAGVPLVIVAAESERE